VSISSKILIADKKIVIIPTFFQTLPVATISKQRPLFGVPRVAGLTKNFFVSKISTECVKDCGLHSEKYLDDTVFACLIGKLDSSHVKI